MGAHILTKADELLELVSEENTVSIGRAAKSLGRDPEQIRLLAESLEDYGKIVIYQTIGDVLLVDKEHYVAMKGSVRGKTGTFLRSLFTSKPRQRTTMDELDMRANALDHEWKTIERRSKALDGRRRELDKEACALENLRETLENLRGQLDEREIALSERDSELTKHEAELRDRSVKLESYARELYAREDRARSLIEKAKSAFDS